MDELAFRPAVELAAAVRSGLASSRQLVELYLERIERCNGSINAVVTVDADGARRQSDERDAERDAGRIRGPLHGVPMTVKDAFATAGIRTTSGSADVSAEVRQVLEDMSERLEAAGAVVDRVARPAFRLVDAERVAFDLWVASTTMSTDDFPALSARAAALPAGRDDRAARRLRAEVMSHHEWADLDRERRRMARAWEALLADHDVVVCPVSLVVAIPHDPESSLVADLDHRLSRAIDVDGRLRAYLEQMTWNIVVGMAGLPSTVAPVGEDSAGLPVGTQIVGHRFADLTTIAFAGALGELTGGYRRPPAMAETAVGDPRTGG